MNKPVIGDPKKERPIKYTGPMRWDAILKRIPECIPLMGAEIGVLHADTAYRILKARPLVTHIMIDPWIVQPRTGSFAQSGDNCSQKDQGFHDTAYNYTVKRVAFSGARARIMRMLSHEAARLISDSSLDYVFIDGDHSYEGVKRDIGLWIGKVKSGGWMGFHDYGMIVNPRLTGVKQAVDEYFKDRKIEMDDEDTAFIVV